MDKPVGGKCELFVSGRLCLFGEHADWAAQLGGHTGYCVVVGTDQGLFATARAADDLVVESLIPDDDGRQTGRTRRMKCPWDAELLVTSAKDPDEFFRYCAGVAHEIMTIPGKRIGGLDLGITRMDLPLKRGVSSSAAACILVAKAFDQIYNLQLLPHEIMDLAYRGELLTGSQCGRMDQACIYGKTVVLLTFRGKGDVHVEPLAVGADIPMFIVDLAGRKDTVRILSDLQGAYHTSEDLRRGLRDENERIVRAAYGALGRGNLEQLGRLMTEAQRNFDTNVQPNSPVELASPLLHDVLSCPDIADLVYGGKGVGSQGDGTAQFVARGLEQRDLAMAKLVAKYPRMRCFPLDIPKTGGVGKGTM